MRAEIITSGTELLLGDIVDTNAAYLSRQLRALGIDVYYRTTVGDNEDRTAAAVSLALSRADLVITTGGLGPTVDDVTRQAVARATGRTLVLHPELVAAIEARFRSFGMKMTENNVQQAHIPEGAVMIPNPVGTAPCFAVETSNGAVISLPGVPRELEYLMSNAVIPYLRGRFGLREMMKTRVLRTCALGESFIDEMIADLMQSTNPTVGLNAHFGQTDVRITAKAAAEEEADRLIAQVEAKLRERLGDNIYGEGNQTLEEVTLGMLHARGETLVVVESVTSGQLSQRLASVPGLRVFLAGVVLPSRRGLQALIRGADTDWITCDVAQSLGEHLRARHAATYALVILGDPESTATPATTIVALTGPHGTTCQTSQRPGKDTPGRTWLATTALNVLRQHILSLGSN